MEKYLKDFWFGYHYNTSAGEWTWFDEPNSTYKAWHRGYPELQNSCARMSENGVWKDRNCDDLLPYICKKPTSKLRLGYDVVHSSRKQHCLARYIQLHLHVKRCHAQVSVALMSALRNCGSDQIFVVVNLKLINCCENQLSI